METAVEGEGEGERGREGERRRGEAGWAGGRKMHRILEPSLCVLLGTLCRYQPDDVRNKHPFTKPGFVSVAL